MLLATILYALLVTAYYYDDMVSQVAIRHSGNHDISRLTLIYVLIGSYVFTGGAFSQRIFAFLVLIYIGTINSSIGASRAAAIPFICAGLSFLHRRNFLTGTLALYLALVALVTAFQTRGSPSYAHFWSTFLLNSYELEIGTYLSMALQYSFPGLATIQAAMIAPGSLSLESLGRFIIYLLPIPSSILPSSLFQDLSLSYVLGINRSSLGINYDILSEGIYWFGAGGAWIFTVTAGLLAILPYYVASKILKSSSNNIYVLCLIANIWMVFGGMVFVLRAGSRAVLALTLLMLVFYFIRKLRFKPKRERVYR